MCGLRGDILDGQGAAREVVRDAPTCDATRARGPVRGEPWLPTPGL
jgi:hypothetical protein